MVTDNHQRAVVAGRAEGGLDALPSRLDLPASWQVPPAGRSHPRRINPLRLLLATTPSFASKLECPRVGSFVVGPIEARHIARLGSVMLNSMPPPLAISASPLVDLQRRRSSRHRTPHRNDARPPPKVVGFRSHHNGRRTGDAAACTASGGWKTRFSLQPSKAAPPEIKRRPEIQSACREVPGGTVEDQHRPLRCMPAPMNHRRAAWGCIGRPPNVVHASSFWAIKS